MKPAPQPTVDVLVPAAAWSRALPAAAAMCRKAARAAIAAGAPKRLRTKAHQAEVSILLTTDAAIRKLNATFRKQDKPTNVLSFPAAQNHPANRIGDGPPDLHLGDVVVAYGTVAREAKESHKSLKDHLSHMVVHGVLHLLGYDHESAADAKTMERLETKILSQLGIVDPYREPAFEPAPSKKRGARRRT
ncbi:MAG: rRNA maturation RNase YbeY [Rhodospirillaceae bacterium]